MLAHKELPEQGLSDGLMAMVAEQGSAAHPMIIRACANYRALNSAAVSDIAHHLCVLHGRYPSIIDHAALKIVDEVARDWILKTSQAFAAERGFLARLTVAAGPVPSSPGDEKSASAIAMQSRAFEMLATSDRDGCAAGAAIAFSQDWQAIRLLLEGIAMRLGLDAPENFFPAEDKNRKLIDDLAEKGIAAQRAIHFGADQILAQQRGFWDLLAARETARAAMF